MVLSTRHIAKRNTAPKGCAQLLVQVPLDVLIEIFLFLEPLDLLHLARTAKVLREFLLSRRKSTGLWKNAISNVKGFPPCPDYMSAPAYTHLAFVPVCHGCFCSCETVDWELRMRCCSDCLPKMTIPQPSALSSVSSSYRNQLDIPMASRRYKLSYDDFVITVSFETVIPPVISLQDWKVIGSRKQAPNMSTTEFVAQQNEFWQSIQRHARSCRVWESGQLQEKAAQLTLTRKQRVKDIVGKLRELGLADVFSSSHQFLRLPQVSRLEPLTPPEWADIRPRLIDWAKKANKNVAWARCFITFTSTSLSVQQELKSDASLKVRPQGIDIAMLPAVRSLLESAVDSDTGNDELRKKLFRILPPAIKKWSSDAVGELEQFAREGLHLPPLSKPSRLPSVIFRCKVCSRKLCPRFRFDEALSHCHLYKERRKAATADEGGEAGKTPTYNKFMMGKYDTYPRNVRALQVDVTVSRRVENLIRRMGQNPSRITYDELRRSTIKVVCGLCPPQAATKMTFEDAFQHCLTAHLREKGEETEVWSRASARE